MHLYMYVLLDTQELLALNPEMAILSSVLLRIVVTMEVSNLP